MVTVVTMLRRFALPLSDYRKTATVATLLSLPRPALRVSCPER